MKTTLTKNQSTNINIIFAYAIKEKVKNCTITRCELINDEYIVTCIRKVTIDTLKRMNKMLNCNIKDKNIRYIITINSNNININCKPIEFDQLSLFDNQMNSKLFNSYNNQINNNIQELKELLIESLYPTDLEQKNWIYFFRAKNYIGFANADLYNKHCLKGTLNNIPLDVWKYYGTYNDACCIRLRKMMNSNFNTHWLMAPDNTKDLSLYLDK